jgi:hypothetical protein
MRSLPPWILLVPLTLCAVLYLPGLSGVLMFDSIEVLARNELLQLDPRDFIYWANALFSTNTGPGGRAVSMASFAASYAVFGSLSPFTLKLVNLLIHGLCGFLAFKVLYRLLTSSPALRLSNRRARWIAITTSTAWLLHPLHVSTVLYAVQRMEQLSALFSLLGLLAYLNYRPRWLQRRATARELSDCTLLVFLCVVAATLSKEDGVLLLPLLLLVEVVFFRCCYQQREYSLLATTAVIALVLVPFIPVVLALSYPPWLEASYAQRDFTLEERLLTQTRVLWQYLQWIFVPDIRPLALHHDTLMISSGLLRPVSTLFSALAWILLITTAVFTWRRWPVFAFCLGWFLVAHMIESSVWPLELVYEHRNYLASLGPCLLVSWCIWCALPRVKWRPRVFATALVFLVLALQLFSRASLWGDEELLVGYHLYNHPESLRSTYHYANTQLQLGEAEREPEEAARRLGLARQYYERMLVLEPGNMTALVTLLYLDSSYFSSLGSESWNRQLLLSASERKITRDDKAALALLLDCLEKQRCDMEPGSYQHMLLTIFARYPDSPVYPDLLARFHGLVMHDYAWAIYYHRQLLERHPDYFEAQGGLVAWHNRLGARSDMLAQLDILLRLDPSPVRVQQIKNSMVPDSE